MAVHDSIVSSIVNSYRAAELDAFYQLIQPPEFAELLVVAGAPVSRPSRVTLFTNGVSRGRSSGCPANPFAIEHFTPPNQSNQES